MRVFFHIEVEEDCLWDEMENPSHEVAAQLESLSIDWASHLFGAAIRKHGRRATDGALICSFETDSLDRVRKIVQDNLITEGNDQIVSGAEYVIIRDFETMENEPLLNDSDEPQCDFCDNPSEDGCHACEVRWCGGCRYEHECPYCEPCQVPGHDACGMEPGCPCCDDTFDQLQEDD